MSGDSLARLGVFANHTSTQPERSITMQGLARMAREPRIGAKEAAPLVVPHDGHGKTLKAAQAARFAAVVIDHDSDNRAAEDIRQLYAGLGVAYLAFTTSSHSTAAPRWKVVVPFARPAEAEIAAQLSKGIAYSLQADPAQARLQQGFYAPNKLTPESDYLHIDELAGEWLQPDDGESAFVMQALQGWENYQKGLESQAHTAPVKSRAVAGTIIEQILQAYDLAALLERHGYQRKGKDLYLSPWSSSGMAGVRLLERDGKTVAYSHHGTTDPLSAENHNGHALDTADVLAELGHGGDFNAMIRAEAERLDPEGQKQRQREYMQEKERQHNAADVDQATEPVQAALQMIPLDDVMEAQPAIVRHAVDPWFPKRHATLFGGHGGMGKSMLALTISAHVAAGVPFAGLPVEQSRVLFVSLEDEASIVRLRLRRIIEHYSLDAGEALANLVLLDGTHTNAAMVQEGQGYGERATLTHVYAEIHQAATDCELIVIDNASDAFDANENSRRDVRFFIRALATLARANDAAVVLLAHIDKVAARNGGGGNDYSGSTAWHNSARSRIALMQDPNHQDDGVSLIPLIVEHQKANLGPKARPVQLEFIEGGVLVPVHGSCC